MLTVTRHSRTKTQSVHQTALHSVHPALSRAVMHQTILKTSRSVRGFFSASPLQLAPPLPPVSRPRGPRDAIPSRLKRWPRRLRSASDIALMVLQTRMALSGPILIFYNRSSIHPAPRPEQITTKCLTFVSVFPFSIRIDVQYLDSSCMHPLAPTTKSYDLAIHTSSVLPALMFEPSSPPCRISSACTITASLRDIIPNSSDTVHRRCPQILRFSPAGRAHLRPHITAFTIHHVYYQHLYPSQRRFTFQIDR